MAEVQDRPPRRRRRPADTPPQDEQPQPRYEPPGKPPAVLKGKLEKFFVGLALPFAAAGDIHCAGILAQRGPVVAEAWANLAAESPAVKRALESMLRGGAWAGAISSTLMLVVPIAAHHGAPIPDPVSAVILGTTSEPEQSGPIVPPAPNGNGNGVTPGPAAVAEPDLTNPEAYPGPHHATNG